MRNTDWKRNNNSGEQQKSRIATTRSRHGRLGALSFLYNLFTPNIG